MTQASDSSPQNAIVATPEDLEDVISLIELQFRDHAIEVPADRLRATVAAALADGALGTFLLEREAGRPIAVAYISFIWALEHCGRSAWLEELYVVPERRGLGVGERLLQAALSHIHARGCATVDLEVEHSHQRAENLYRRAGFVPVTRTRWVRRMD